jgi:hypothetical protein
MKSSGAQDSLWQDALYPESGHIIGGAMRHPTLGPSIAAALGGAPPPCKSFVNGAL